ncbi:MAG: hypothetical protein WAT43_02005 [Chitinophagales bacterium]|nr:hypothetical protein [Bacteroidota bacterium]
MKNKITTMITCCLMTAGVFAQNFDLDWGTATEAGSNSASYLPIGFHGGFFYTVQFEKGDGNLIKVDTKNNIVMQKELVTAEKKFETEMMFSRGENIIFLNTDFENKENRLSVLATSFNYTGKLLSVKPKSLVSITVEKNNEITDLKYKLSPDSSKLLIIMDHNMPNKENARFTACVVGTNDLKLIWQDTYDVEYDDTDFSLLSWAVDNNGNALALAVISGGEGKRLMQYSTRMFSIDAASKKIVDRELKIDGKYISSALIRFVTNNNLMITGFYNELTDKGKNEGIEGAFMCITDVQNLENLDLRTHKIDAKTKAAITPSGGWAKMMGGSQLNAYNIRDIGIHADGSGYVIAEQQYITYSSSSNSESRTFNFNHIIIYAFDANQEITYMASIPKYQRTTITAPKLSLGGAVSISVTVWTGSLIRQGYKYNSYISYEQDGKIYIMYNDHRDNGDARTLDDVKVMANKDKANAVIVTVDSEGKWEKEALFIGKDIDVILETSSSMPIPNEGFIISCERKKDVQYARIKIE